MQVCSYAKEKTLCAPHEPQKVLVVELVVSLFPMNRMPIMGHRLDGSPDH
jgi:hypothetical protein